MQNTTEEIKEIKGFQITRSTNTDYYATVVRVVQTRYHGVVVNTLFCTCFGMSDNDRQNAEFIRNATRMDHLTFNSDVVVKDNPVTGNYTLVKARYTSASINAVPLTEGVPENAQRRINNTWIDMELAPLDGTRILGKHTNGEVFVCYYFVSPHSGDGWWRLSCTVPEEDAVAPVKWYPCANANEDRYCDMKSVKPDSVQEFSLDTESLVHSCND